MLRELSTDEIHGRVKALNLTLRWLARAAGVDAMTAWRGAKTVRKHNALVEALSTEELRLLRHLARLYPQEATAATCPERGQAA